MAAKRHVIIIRHEFREIYRVRRRFMSGCLSSFEAARRNDVKRARVIGEAFTMAYAHAIPGKNERLYGIAASSENIGLIFDEAI